MSTPVVALTPEEAQALVERVSHETIAANYGEDWEATGAGFQFAKGVLAGSAAMLVALGIVTP